MKDPRLRAKPKIEIQDVVAKEVRVKAPVVVEPEVEEESDLPDDPTLTEEQAQGWPDYLRSPVSSGR